MIFFINSTTGEDVDSWEETFQTWTDTKVRGPEGLSMDFTFPQADVLFGIPEHADSFALRLTSANQTDPYRLYNLDVAYHEINSTMALYGASPVLYGHGYVYIDGISEVEIFI